MNQAAIIKHNIYGKLNSLSGADLNSVSTFIDFVHHQKRPVTQKKIIKFQGILADYDLDLSDLKKCKSDSWKHLEGEFNNE